jgi:hypothetical protein
MEKRNLVPVVMLLASVILPSPASAQDEIRGKPIDFYISIFGGTNSVSNTDVKEDAPLYSITARNVELKSSSSIGGKIGFYTNTHRAQTGFDFGAELDITNFSPDQQSGRVVSVSGTVVGTPVVGAALTNQVNINSTIVAVNFLIRKPFGVTEDLPNGRWYPYAGIGGGFQTSSYSTPTTTGDGRQTDPAFQGLLGAKVFFTQHVALFGEYKFTHASHDLKYNIVGGGSVTDNYTFNVNHFVAGLAMHF